MARPTGERKSKPSVSTVNSAKCFIAVDTVAADVLTWHSVKYCLWGEICSLERLWKHYTAVKDFIFPLFKKKKQTQVFLFPEGSQAWGKASVKTGAIFLFLESFNKHLRSVTFLFLCILCIVAELVVSPNHSCVFQAAVKLSVKAAWSIAAMDRHLSAAPTTPTSATSSRRLPPTHKVFHTTLKCD